MSKVILCADDSVTMQTVAEITFRTTEYAYVGARSTDEAIDKIKAQRPALVLADAVMPGKTGYDLCHALKSDPATADIPVVILCGNSAPYDGARGGAAGADGSLTKPWDTQVMLDKVAEILDKVSSGGVAKATGKPGQAPAPSTVATTVPLGGSAAAQPAPIAAPAAAPAQPKIAPPRSATIMGMPTIKMPGPGTPMSGSPIAPPPVAAPIAPPPIAPPPIAPPPVAVQPPPVAAPSVAAASAPAPRTVQAPAATAAVAQPASRPAAPPVASFSTARAPMVSGIPTKRSAVVERTLAKMGERLAELSGLAAGSAELTALVRLSSEVVERIVWEIVPELAETIVREHVEALAARRSN